MFKKLLRPIAAIGLTLSTTVTKAAVDTGGLAVAEDLGDGIVATLEAISLPIFLAALVFAAIAFFAGRGWGMIAGILIGGLILGNPTDFADFFGIS